LVDRENLSAAEAASLLQWWADAGVDVLVDEHPRDWLQPKAKAPPAASPAAPADALPGQLDLFQEYLRTSHALPFAAPLAPRVCPSGDPASGLMIMIAMPEAADCESGTLLAGAAGRLFDRMMAAIGRDRASLYLASLSCFRSATGRLTDPASGQCAALARHHIGLVAPRALLLFGDSCARALLGLSVAQARGRWHEIATHAGPVKTIVTIAPDYLLKQPPAKAHAWADLQMLVQGLDG
jgi:uracil-DNA glycosylase